MSAEVLQLDLAEGAIRARRIELALEPRFKLGDLTVEPALREITSSNGSRQTLEPRVMQVLVALARADGATVSRDELIRRCWNGTVVGEDSINRTISLLRRMSEGLEPQPFRIETIPRIGYRLVVAVPRPGTGNADAAPPVRLITGHPHLATGAILAVVLAAIVAAFALWRPAPEGPLYSLSVRPFQVSGAAAAFNDELPSRLSSLDVPTVAGRFNLALVGTAAENDGAIRVNARLIDADSRQVVWSGAVSRSATEPDGLVVAAATIGHLAQCTLAGANDAGGAVPLDILARYARTCELGFRRQSAQGLRTARELTRKAPDFAAGWFALSYHAYALYMSQPDENDALRAEALAAAGKLIALRPDAQDGYLRIAVALGPAETADRESLLRRAVRTEPLYAGGAEAYLGDFLMQVGRFEEGFQQAIQQPPSADPAMDYARRFLAGAATDRWPFVDATLEQMQQFNPSFMPNLLWRKAVWEGDWAEAERLAPQELPAQYAASVATYRAMASGNPAQHAEAAQLVLALPDACCVHLRIELLTLLNRPAEAIGLLDKFDAARVPGARPGTVGLLFLADPTLRPLWRHPAIEAFFQRNGWITYWRATKTKPDICGQDRPPSFCRLLETKG